MHGGFSFLLLSLLCRQKTNQRMLSMTTSTSLFRSDIGEAFYNKPRGISKTKKLLDGMTDYHDVKHLIDKEDLIIIIRNHDS